MFDIIFLSYNESNADANWEHLKKCMPYPFVKRVNGVEGILNGHRAAAKFANTRYFFVVDGDSHVLPSFKFDFNVSGPNVLDIGGQPDINRTYVWRAKNPLNDLVYGYGGIKLFRKESILNKDKMEMDMTLSIDEFTVIDEIASTTNFNTSGFETWKSAFRECTKLSQQFDAESQERLNIWMTKAKGKFAADCIMGAKDGVKFGKNKENSLKNINNFNWLREKYEQRILK